MFNLFSLFKSRKDNTEYLEHRIERYVSPRATKVYTGINNPIHTKLREELESERLAERMGR